jgi:hypothetical protein
MRHSITLVLLGTMLSPAAVAQTQAPHTCALLEPDAPHLSGHGTILGFEDPAASRAGIPGREAQRGGAIDPGYRNDVRVVVRQDDGFIDKFDVPAGVTVHVGDRVKLQGSYRSTASACSYIPHLIFPDDGPAV